MAFRGTLLTISLVLVIENKFTITGGEESRGLRRCCATGSWLTFDGEYYSCESRAPDDVPEFFQRSPDEVSGWPVSDPEIPACDNSGNLTSIPLADIPFDFSFRNSCIDILIPVDYEIEPDGAAERAGGDQRSRESDFKTAETLQPTVLYCAGDNNAGENFIDSSFSEPEHPTLLKIRRCCPEGEVFDIDQRACLPPEDPARLLPTASLVRNIGNSDFVFAIRGAPKCQNAIVDYEVNSSDVSIVANRLQVSASDSYDIVDLLATEDSACLDAGGSPGLLVVRTCRGVEYCEGNPCLRKCCAEDEALFSSTCQKLESHQTLAKWHSEVWELPRIMQNETKKILNTTEYGLLVGKPCLYGMYPVLRNEEWHITPEGMVHVPGYKTYEHQQHCMEMFYNSSIGPDDLYPFICFEDPPPPEDATATRFQVNATLLSISCAFLLITLLVYICLPALQNLHGKTLMCHVGSLLMAYICLTMVAVASPADSQLDPADDANDAVDSTSLCILIGYMMLFSFLSTFFWLNVICFDIWWKFGSLRHSGRSNTRRRENYKRFLFYCLYAWGLALVFMLLAVATDMFKLIPKYLRPGIGMNRCWFSTGRQQYGEVLFFTGPVSLQLVVNLIFFILTARRCSMVKAEIQRRVKKNQSDGCTNRRFESDKSKLILNVKLFVVMGISWVLEIVSYLLNHYMSHLSWKTEFFYVSDVVNCLQGLLIFMLFVLKKKVFYALRRKLGWGGKKRESTGGIHDPYRVRKSPSTSTILSTFAVSSSP
ncbi:G-protein coupled receptor Mth2 [Athalia rosae]|uniref:G-protein coupled receptor Mth2 n=1 Tax=Athalia rosae TaxID=37344 RepID=UPI00203373B3|nr:G-protein coupled receptor Mth2 [Athalia rosae]